MKIKIDSWEKCSINDYYRILDICNEEGLSDMEKNLKLCAVICDCSEDDIYSLPIPEARELIKALKFMEGFKFNQGFHKTTLYINGQKYNINPNISEMTIAQYIDFQTFWGKKDLRKYYGNILACFIIPEGKKYNDGYDVLEFANELMDSISIKLANEIMSFFVSACLLSIKAIQIYSSWIVKKMGKKIKDKEQMEMIEKNLKEIQDMYGLV